MKSAIAMLLMFSSVQTLAAKNVDFDGCYQMLNPGVMYQKICLQGTAEEGINGSGVRLGVFRTNTGMIEVCATSTASGVLAGQPNSFYFELNGVKEIVLKNINVTRGVMDGDVTVDPARNLKFVKLDPKSADYLVKEMNKVCKF